MRLHRAVALLLLSLLTNCATARGVRLETDRGELITFPAPRTDEAGPVKLEEDEFKEALSEHARTRRPPAHPQEAARRLFEMDVRGGTYLIDARTRRVTPLGPGEHLYLGVDRFWGLITGFRGLVDEADRARTFDELRDAGERYGKVMGRNAARAFAMLATVAIGNTAAGFAGKVPTLPVSVKEDVG
jgi:hypothetical protein